MRGHHPDRAFLRAGGKAARAAALSVGLFVLIALLALFARIDAFGAVRAAPARAAAPSARAAAPAPARAAKQSAALLPTLAPASAFRYRFDNVEGAILLEATLRSTSGVDTSGILVMDTGAGFLALDGDLLSRLGLIESPIEPMTFAAKPLPRLSMGALQQDQVSPVMGIETDVIHQVTDRHVFGLLGQKPLNSFAVRIDYQGDSLALIPMPQNVVVATRPRRPIGMEMAASQAATLMATRASREALGGHLAANATALPFELLGDGKILVPGSIGEGAPARGEPLQLVLDTGATKTVLFPRALQPAEGRGRWSHLRGLSAPTLYGSESAYVVRVPAMALGTGSSRSAALEVDAVVIEGPLESALAQAVGRPIDGLIGYSFLRRFRVTIDYPHRLLWLEPVKVARDQRPFEYSHVGVQIERRNGRPQVVAVATDSPADSAGMRADDEVIEVDGESASGLDLVTLSRRLEGPPGTIVRLRVRRGGEEISFRIPRRQLL